MIITKYWQPTSSGIKLKVGIYTLEIIKDQSYKNTLIIYWEKSPIFSKSLKENSMGENSEKAMQIFEKFLNSRELDRFIVGV